MKKKIHITNRMISMGACLVFSIVLLITFISCYYVDICIRKEAQAQKNRYEWTQLGEILEDTSDFLTSQVRQYVITGDSGYFYNYWNEVYEVKSREMAVEKLKLCHLTNEEIHLLEKAKKNSDALIKTEAKAMKMKMQVQDIVVNHNEKKEKYRDLMARYKLSKEYENFSDQQLEVKAVEILYEDTYENTKKEIMTPIHAFQNSINKRLNIEVSKTVESRAKALRVQIACLIVSLGLIGIWLVLIQKLYVQPIRSYTDIISKRNRSKFLDQKTLKVLPTGVYEMRYLGEMFNQLSCSLQTELALRIRAENRMREARDKAKSASKAKGEFLAKMSHEFRTPLNSIIGYLYLLRKTSMIKKQKEYCASMKIASESLLKLINQVLDLAKIESGQMEFEYKASNIKEMVKEIELVLKQPAVDKGLEFKTEVDDKIPNNVLVDVFRLKQVLINLIGNGIKFSNDGQVILYVKLEEIKNNYCRVFFGVKDSGIGISEEGKKIIFQDFVQSDSTITRRFGGTGLGLPIAKKIIEEFNHGKDTLHIESEEEKGSYFYFNISFEIVNENKGEKAKGIDDINHKYEFCAQRVLLVDDNELNLRVEREILRKAGLQVSIADSGEKALQLIENNIYDLILLDIRMPDMSGYELAERIREHETYKTIPMIALTADIMGDAAEKIRKSGIDYYLAKPLQPVKLLYVLNHELEIKENNRSIFIGKELLRILENDREAYEELIVMFIKEQDKNLKNIQKALINSDYGELENTLHKMKGIAGSIYCNLLYETVSDLHKKTKSGQRIKLDILWEVWNNTKQKMLEEIKNREVQNNV